MQLPQADSATIAPEKIRDYLLSPSHPVGRFKANFFSELGFSQDLWQELEGQIRVHAQSGDVALGSASEYGQKYIVRGDLRGPSGRTARILSVWIVRRGDTVPRFVTAYPGG
jgi:hypothetical protein